MKALALVFCLLGIGVAQGSDGIAIRAAGRLVSGVSRDLGRLAELWRNIQPYSRDLTMVALPPHDADCSRCKELVEKRRKVDTELRLYLESRRKSVATSLEAKDFDEVINEKRLETLEIDTHPILTKHELQPYALRDAVLGMKGKISKEKEDIEKFSKAVLARGEESQRAQLSLEVLLRAFQSEMTNLKTGVDPTNLHMLVHFARETQRLIAKFDRILLCGASL